MDKDERTALFTQLGRMEEKLDSLSSLKPKVETNTKFRWFVTAFITCFISLISVLYKTDKIFASVKSKTVNTKVLK